MSEVDECDDCRSRWRRAPARLDAIAAASWRNSARLRMAAITFTAEAGHRYEAEVRADPIAFSTRVFRSGEWTPVVRDRTTDRIVSSVPVWSSEASCR